MGVNLTIERILPDISEEERKANMESLYNTICRIKKIPNFSHCEYDINTNTIHIIVTKGDH